MKSNNETTTSPLMRQFNAIREKHSGKILFFRMGDFYEMFGDDAVKAAPILGITLTSRSQGGKEKIPLAGVPYHSADRYLAKLLASGEKVVVVEQVEDPKTAKGIVKREVVEILTPGTSTVDSDRPDALAGTLASVYSKDNKIVGMALLDLATGLFLVDQGDKRSISERLKVMSPAEIIFPEAASSNGHETFSLLKEMNTTTTEMTPFEEWNFDLRTAQRDLNDLFGTSTLDGFGINHDKLAIIAAGAILRYLRENCHNRLSHITRLTKLDNSDYMTLDYSSVRNLELIQAAAGGGNENTLLAVMNRCQTAAGTRRLKQSLLRPFKNKGKIEFRLGAISEFVTGRDLCFRVREATKLLPDLEKLTGRLGIGKLNPRQAAAIGKALCIAEELKVILSESHSPHLGNIHRTLPKCNSLIQKINNALVDDPPVTTNKGGILKKGFSLRLDELNNSIKSARDYIGSLQESERKRTGIPSLKVGFNKVFGYYLSVTHTHKDLVPDNYIRKQTLVNAERFIIPELKEKEELIFAAEEKIFNLEQELFGQLVDEIGNNIADLLMTAQLLAELDLVSSLAELAAERGYCRPEIYEDSRCEIVSGRHPVVESVLPPGTFVANDLSQTEDRDRIIILTGPNMSGKSTYLRQIGLIVIMAQIGSFVPADKAEIGLVDRVFTRVGALDNLAGGQSTFLVEMVETANILNNATEKSIVLLDEVGRGTSTFDGLSVAWSVVEAICETSKCRTIFATHYHELTNMSDMFESVSNFQVQVKKWEDKVIFLHKIIAGGCDDSYGIEVARLAGLPKRTINRARQILRLLESGKFNQSELGESLIREKVQTSLFDQKNSVVEEMLQEIDLDNITPVEAFDFLRKLKNELE